MNILIKTHNPAANEISYFINSIFLGVSHTLIQPALAPVSTLQIKCPGVKKL